MKIEKIIFNLEDESQLFDSVAKYFGDTLGTVSLLVFSDGEQHIEFKKEDIADKHVYFFVSTTSSILWVRLLLATDAAQKANPNKITVIMPYMGYARQDLGDRALYASSCVSTWSRLLQCCGVDEVVTVDIHSTDAFECFSDIRLSNYSAQSILVDHLKKNHMSIFSLREAVIVSPDRGSTELAESYTRDLSKFGLTSAQIEKVRGLPNTISSMKLYGDVHGKHIILVDDMADTCGTLINASDLLLQEGALTVTAVVTHALLSGDAISKLENSSIKKLIVTDTVGVPDHEMIEVVSVAPYIAEKLGLKEEY